MNGTTRTDKAKAARKRQYQRETLYLTPEEKEARNAEISAYQRYRRATMTPEEKAEHLAKQRAARRRWWASLSPEQRTAMVERRNAMQRARRKREASQP